MSDVDADQVEDAIAAEMTPESEAPEPNTEPDTEPTPEGEPEPESDTEPSSYDNIERMAGSLDKLSKHVAKRITEIMGESAADFEECDICTYWNTPGWRMKGPLPEAVEQALRLALDGHRQDEFQTDEFSKPCEKCNGLGVVLTGSRVQGQESLPCMVCKNLGWLPVGQERATGAFATPNGPQAAPPLTLATGSTAITDTPELTAAKAELAAAGYFVVPPVAQVG